MRTGNKGTLPPDPQTVGWADRAGLLTSRAAAVEVLSGRAMALRDMLWVLLATAVVAAGWGVSSATVGWYLDLDDRGGAALLVVFMVVTVSVLAMGLGLVVCVLVARRGRAAQRLLEAWTALDRQPLARSLPPGNIPQPLASTWDLMRAGQPWQENTGPLGGPGLYGGRRYLVFLSGKSLAWMIVPLVPLMFGVVMALAALTRDAGQEGNGPVVQVAQMAQVAMAGAGAVFAAAGLWAIGKWLRHYLWALREARARVSEERAWPVTPARW
ncbi:hypothetical protein [Streptomyces sp. NPDC002851]